jgi:hypothetical protein
MWHLVGSITELIQAVMLTVLMFDYFKRRKRG